jgi:8-oxo-dGTP pyrophosphatase MutT (NUDIX family)
VIDKLSEITQQEASRLFLFSFDDIWEDLYLDKINKTFITERHRARQNFNTLKSRYSTEIQLSKTTICEWGIPKGRRKPRETGFDCACREWYEETTIDTEKLSIINTNPFYYHLDYGERHVCVECWLSRISPTTLPEQITSVRSYVSEEVGRLEWCSLTSLKNILPNSIFNMLVGVEDFIVEHLV